MKRYQDRRPGAGRYPAYLTATGVVAATLGLAFMASHVVNHASLSLMFLASVVIVSAWTGLGPSLFASLLGFLALNFFFTQPYYTLEVADKDELATLLFFLLMAAVTGNLAARMQREIIKRRASLRRTSNLYAFNRRMASAADADDVLEALAAHLARSMDCPVAVYTAGSRDDLRFKARAGSPVSMGDDALQGLWRQSSSAAAYRDGCYGMKLDTDHGSTGMAVIQSGELDGAHLELARSLCDQAAVALSRTQLVERLEEARIKAETEQLRSALLSSVSHDLRTPLASIIGSTTSLLEYGQSISEDNRRELLSTVVDEAKRLDRHIQNLLDMTRLGHGRLKLKRDWVDVHDIVSSAVDRMRDALKGVRMKIDIAEDVPLAWVHGALVEQALVNILDNAIDFSPPGGTILIEARHSGGYIQIEVCDEGPGIPDTSKEKVFDMFYTAGQTDRADRTGTGLGLAICSGIVGAHGGSIEARDRTKDGGACIRFTLPAGREGEAPDDRHE